MANCAGRVRAIEAGTQFGRRDNPGRRDNQCVSLRRLVARGDSTRNAWMRPSEDSIDHPLAIP